MNMKKKQLERLLNTACEIITDLEIYNTCNSELQDRIEAFFQEILHSDDLDQEMQLTMDNSLHYSEEQLVADLIWDKNGIGRHSDADAEMQDFEIFKQEKV